jgi:5-(hydroxymethyl)furfural/furfural oxidase
MQTLEARGHPIRPDQNGPWQDGAFRGAIAVSDAGERLPTSIAYLTPEVRRRPNLKIVTDSVATRILFDGYLRLEPRSPASCQNDHSPGGHRGIRRHPFAGTAAALRHRPRQRSAALGIPVVTSRSGVGRNLMEHPSIAVAAFLPPHMRVRDKGEHHEQAVWRFSSNVEGTPSGDMHAAILSRSGWHSVGLRMGGLFFWVNKSYSRGMLTLSNPDPRVEPDVDFRMLSDDRDLERLKSALRIGAQTLRDPHMNGARGTVFPSSYSPRVARVAAPGLGNAHPARRTVGDAGHGGAVARSTRAFRHHAGHHHDGLLADDPALTAFVRQHVGGTWHPPAPAAWGLPMIRWPLHRHRARFTARRAYASATPR